MLQIIDIVTGHPRNLTPAEQVEARVALGAASNAALDQLNTDIDLHTSNTSNPHGVTKSQVGLSQVDNTADSAKPVSSATATALQGIATDVTALEQADQAITQSVATLGAEVDAITPRVSYAATQPPAADYNWWNPSTGLLYKSNGTTWTQVNI